MNEGIARYDAVHDENEATLRTQPELFRENLATLH